MVDVVAKLMYAGSAMEDGSIIRLDPPGAGAKFVIHADAVRH